MKKLITRGATVLVALYFSLIVGTTQATAHKRYCSSKTNTCISHGKVVKWKKGKRTYYKKRRYYLSKKRIKRRYKRKASRYYKRKRYNRGRGGLIKVLKSVLPRGLPINLAKAVITVESGWRVNARGSSGEIGLMQLMPATARSWGARKNAYNPKVNMRAGTKYLNYCYKRAGKHIGRTISCYNAGPGRMNAYKRIRITRNYVRKVRGML